MTRLQLMQAHALLAAFIFPVAVMFMTTGALYTWGIKGAYVKDVYEVKLSKPLQADVVVLKDLAEVELKKRDLSSPKGNAKVKTLSGHYLLEWTGSSKDIILEPTDNQLIAKLTVKNTSWYRHLVQLHKAKGGILFKVYAVIFALAIGLLLISGLIMAWQTPKLKGFTLTMFLMGLGSFILMVTLS